jgi:hypothetical protein
VFPAENEECRLCFFYFVGLSPFHHSAIKYDTATALANLKTNLFSQQPEEPTPNPDSLLRSSGEKGSANLGRTNSNLAANNKMQSPPFEAGEWFGKMRKLERFLYLHGPTGDVPFDATWTPLLLKLVKLLMTNDTSGMQDEGIEIEFTRVQVFFSFHYLYYFILFILFIYLFRFHFTLLNRVSIYFVSLLC